MKTHNFSISLFSVLCVLCAGITTDALSATVKTLGGAGTINGTAAASNTTRVAPTRAGALRVTPSSARLVTSNNNSATTTSGATTTNSVGGNQRLSIGKYLGGATTASSAATNAASAQEVEDINTRLDSLETAVGTPSAAGGKDLSDRIAELEEKQIQSSDDGVIVVENGEVSVDMAALKKSFFGVDDEDNIQMKYDDESGTIQWKYNDGDWKTLVNLDVLTGTYATANALSTAISNLANVYLSKIDAAATYQTLSNITQTINAESTTTQYPSAAAVYTALSTVSGSAANIATQVNEKIGDLGAYETVEDALAAKQNVIDDLSAIRSGAAAGATAVQPASLATVATTGSYNDLSNKPDLADVATGGSFTDLNEVAALGDIEIGKVRANDGKQWVWGYVNGEPQFIRVVDE